MKTLSTIALIIIACIISACCTPISLITEHPERYRGQTVTVKGRVINTLRLEDLSFFTIKNHGKINITTTSFLPVKDDYVRVRGVVDDKFYYQRDTILIIREIVKIDEDAKPDFNRMVN
ncbi:MAG: hypothetical protein IKR94_08290 [Bacteroidales bacterium]|nr:hypothetical protein [Bacteroidales bacterium]MBR4215303.1 hypothetical protein [Bacteroidales bacterium]